MGQITVLPDGSLKMDKDTRRALNALTAVEKGPAWSRAAAYIIPHPDRKRWGKIKVSYPKDGMGPLRAFVWDCEGNDGLKYGSASGCGYDKLSAAMCGLKFDNITFSDHPVNWEIQLRKAGYEVIQAL